MAAEERGEVIVGLDIGTTKICVVVGEVCEGRVDIIGIGQHPSVGLRRGMVVNIESTMNSIRSAVDEAAEMAKLDISSVYVGIAGSHISGFNSSGQLALKYHEIRQSDVDLVMESAGSRAIPQDREIIHILPQGFMVDDQLDIQDPIGMSGVRLEADVHIVTGSATAVQNIVKCCNRAGLTVHGVVLEPLASAEAVLTREEMELGVALLDIGGGTSDLAIFVNGAIRHTFVLGLGGHNLTNDLSVGLRTPVKAAERLKEKYGSALSSMIDQDQVVEVPSVGGRKSRKLSRKVMGEILEPRVEEMLSLLNKELTESNFKELVATGIVMTGGTSLLTHMEELAEQIFDLPVRIGCPCGVGGVVEVDDMPQWATGVGLVIYGMNHASGQRVALGRSESIFGRGVSRMKDWFRSTM